MDVVSRNIKSLRLANGWTQEQLADKVGVTRATVTQWETGWSQPRMGKVAKLADVFGVSMSEIVNEPHDGGFVSVPLFGRIAAGDPLEMDAVEATGEIPPAVYSKYPRGFLLTVTGESMNRILPNGCRALIDPCDEIEHDGAPYAVCVNGYDATIKRVRKLENGFELSPDSTDPTFRPTVYDYGVDGTDRVTVIGRVVYYVLPYDWEF